MAVKVRVRGWRMHSRSETPRNNINTANLFRYGRVGGKKEQSFSSQLSNVVIIYRIMHQF